MVKIQLTPDLNKIQNYMGTFDLDRWGKAGYVELQVRLEQGEYEKCNETLVKLIEESRLKEHTQELLYIIYILDDDEVELSFQHEERHRWTQNAVELSKFLLAIDRSKESPFFEIGIRENVSKSVEVKIQTTLIKNPEIAKWLCSAIWEKIEREQIPHFVGDVFQGEVVPYFKEQNYKLSIESLKRGSLMKSSMTTLKNIRLVLLCLGLQKYLNQYTYMRIDTRINSQQARFFYYVLFALKLVKPLYDATIHEDFSSSKYIGSTPEKYITTLFDNYFS